MARYNSCCLGRCFYVKQIEQDRSNRGLGESGETHAYRYEPARAFPPTSKNKLPRYRYCLSPGEPERLYLWKLLDRQFVNVFDVRRGRKYYRRM